MILLDAGSLFCQLQLGLLVLQGVWKVVKDSGMELLGPEENQELQRCPSSMQDGADTGRHGYVECHEHSRVSAASSTAYF